MTETPEPAQPTAAEPQSPSAWADERQMSLIVYVLFLASFAFGITSIVGVVLAYVQRDTAPDWLKSHYTFQIRTFWVGLLYGVISGVACIALIGFPMLVAVMVWFIVRCALGLSRLLRGEAYPTPGNWLV